MILIAALVIAQTKPNIMDSGVAWLQQAWTTVQSAAEPIAEAAIRRSRAEFKAIPQRVHGLAATISKAYANAKLEEKEALLAELWRIRGSLNLMQLMDPTLLHQLTGIDAKTLAGLESTVAHLLARLAPHRPVNSAKGEGQA